MEHKVRRGCSQCKVLATQLDEALRRLGRCLDLLRAVQKAKQTPGISDGEHSGSFHVYLHGNWFINCDLMTREPPVEWHLHEPGEKVDPDCKLCQSEAYDEVMGTGAEGNGPNVRCGNHLCNALLSAGEPHVEGCLGGDPEARAAAGLAPAVEIHEHNAIYSDETECYPTPDGVENLSPDAQAKLDEENRAAAKWYRDRYNRK